IVEDLDRDRSVEKRVLGKKHDAHAAATNLAFNPVSAAKQLAWSHRPSRMKLALRYHQIRKTRFGIEGNISEGRCTDRPTAIGKRRISKRCQLNAVGAGGECRSNTAQLEPISCQAALNCVCGRPALQEGLRSVLPSCELVCCLCRIHCEPIQALPVHAAL